MLSAGGLSEEKEDPSAWKLAVNRRVTTPHTLTAVTVKVTGKIRFEDFDAEYSQQVSLLSIYFYYLLENLPTDFPKITYFERLGK